jgi:hypothetical protein
VVGVPGPLVSTYFLALDFLASALAAVLAADPLGESFFAGMALDQLSVSWGINLNKQYQIRLN